MTPICFLTPALISSASFLRAPQITPISPILSALAAESSFQHTGERLQGPTGIRWQWRQWPGIHLRHLRHLRTSHLRTISAASRLSRHSADYAALADAFRISNRRLHSRKNSPHGCGAAGGPVAVGFVARNPSAPSEESADIPSVDQTVVDCHTANAGGDCPRAPATCDICG